MRKAVLAIMAVAAVTTGGIFLTASPPAPPHPGAPLSGSAMVAVSLPETLSDSARIGETMFNAKCAACHGPHGAGQDGVAPPLVHKIYEPNHHADMSFVLAVQRGVRAHHWRFGDMPPVNGLTRADVDSVVAYVRALQRANGIN